MEREAREAGERGALQALQEQQEQEEQREHQREHHEEQQGKNGESSKSLMYWKHWVLSYSLAAPDFVRGTVKGIKQEGYHTRQHAHNWCLLGANQTTTFSVRCMWRVSLHPLKIRP